MNSFFRRLFVHLVPLLLNFIYGGMFFITIYTFNIGHAPGFIVGGVIAAWGVLYCLVSSFLGKIVTTENSPRFVIVGGTLLTLGNLAFLSLLNASMYYQFVGICLIAVGGALICMPFQIFIKSLESADAPDTGVARATAFYTASWSVGFACGPLLFGNLLPWCGFVVTLVSSVLITALFVMIALTSKKAAKPTPSVAVVKPAQLPKNSEQGVAFPAWLGWIVGGVCTFAICQIRAVWPILGEDLVYSKAEVANVVFITHLAQAASALFVSISSKWLYRPLSAWILGLCATAALILFGLDSPLAFLGLNKSLAMFLIGGVLFGTYSGMCYFYLVFHSLSHPKSSFYVAGNEVVVGSISIVAPLLGGIVAKSFNSRLPFLLSVILVIIATGLQFYFTARWQSEQRKLAASAKRFE